MTKLSGQSKPVSIGMAGIALVMIVALIVVFQIGTPTAKAPPTAPKTPEAIAREKAEENRFRTTAALVALLKQATRNPATFQIDDVLANDDASIVCLRYRGQNGFGGISIESVAIINGKASAAAKDWNNHCAGKPLYDMKHVRHAIN